MHQRTYPLNKSMTLGKSSHTFQLSYLSKRDNTPAYLKTFIKAKYMKWVKSLDKITLYWEI